MSKGFVVVSLLLTGVERWFEIGQRPSDIALAAQRLRAVLASIDPKDPFRLVLLDPDDRVRAKVGGYVTRSGRLRLWAVRHAPGENRTTRAQLTRLLVQACLERSRANPRVRFVECCPAFDTPDRANLEAAIHEAGLRLVASAHNYERTLPLGRPPALPAGVTLATCASGSAALEQLFAEVNAFTLDRLEQDQALSTQETLLELREQAGGSADSDLWQLALANGAPAGYVLCGFTPAVEGQPAEGEILEIGVIPSQRRRGLAQALLGAALTQLTARGAATATAMIDDVNLPSIRLHERLGFTREEGDYCTWRLHLRRSASVLNDN